MNKLPVPNDWNTVDLQNAADAQLNGEYNQMFLPAVGDGPALTVDEIESLWKYSVKQDVMYSDEWNIYGNALEIYSYLYSIGQTGWTPTNIANLYTLKRRRNISLSEALAAPSVFDAATKLTKLDEKMLHSSSNARKERTAYQNLLNALIRSIACNAELYQAKIAICELTNPTIRDGESVVLASLSEAELLVGNEQISLC